MSTSSARAPCTFEEEKLSAKQDGRFLTVKLRGKCTEQSGKVHEIEKIIMIEALLRHTTEIEAITRSRLIKIDSIQVYERNRDSLNLIIIPTSCSVIILLAIVTFGLRSIREKQKRRHIEGELEKRRTAKQRAANSANSDPNAGEKQRLLQPEPLVGRASDTLGSPKEFTNDRDDPRLTRPFRQDTNANNRIYTQDSPTIIDIRSDPASTGGSYYRQPSDERMSRPYRDEQVQYRDEIDGRSSRQDPQPMRSSRERMQNPYNDNPAHRFSPNHDEILMTERDQMYQAMPPSAYMVTNLPRVVVRSVHADADFASYHPQQQQQHHHQDETMFVPIPVQIERGGVHARFPSYETRTQPFMPPNYDEQQTHSYYRHVNA
ncbi:unnamed protein product [Didymodactylos carnosus]|uniref:Uncharacterized protein n=1 Tax=Didymodactylos carnosus TaxID=1234261 RepID=A0A815B3K3_9BILA|nr:unnamed protein product [Didymodactylos carnosus]CAF1317582.1 unnamed protein product [Didymodactylos carnosus]CAF4048484.1 unnamed protein product [Didymodactylos carnosus]CAF4126900.1 unnamed protein product [Didymodactylos carnosus]